MRTLLVGLIGGALVFTFFWYRGDVGVITLPVLGELAPPQALQPALDRLAAAPRDARAVHAEFAPSAPIVDLTTAPDIYAGQLIAKPREVAAADEAEEAAAGARLAPSTLSRRLTARAISAPMPAARALQAANQIGVVETTVGGGMLISLDYDLMDEALEEAAPEPAAPGAPPSAATRSLSLQSTLAPQGAANAVRGLTAEAVTQARPLAFDAGETVRARAMRQQARRLKWARDARCPDNVDAEMIRANPAIGVSCAIERLEASGEFEYVEPNVIVTHEMAQRPGPTVGVAGEPNDPLFPFQWDYRSQGEEDGQSAGGAGFEDFWTRAAEQGSRDIVVAVIDTGLDMDHPDIRNSPNVAQGVDMVSIPFYANDGDGRDRDPSDPGDICDPSDPEAEDSYHGTHVAGTIGASATNDGAGVAGGAWNVTIVPIRALGRCGGLQSDINDAIRWAAGVEPVIIEDASGTELVTNEHPADIINLSLGFRAPDGCPRSTQEAIDDAVAAGAIVVAAAGNAGINVDGYGPSGCDNVVTVSAGDGAGALAYYSNWGDKVDIMAPGGDLRADLDHDGRPDGILSTRRSANCVDPVTNDPVGECRYSYENGTSMAAPHVSAAFALLKSKHPEESNNDLIATVLDIARQPRALEQCVGPCAETPGAPAVDGMDGMCHRACGAGLLDLSLAVDE
jgi:serine protease